MKEIDEKDLEQASGGFSYGDWPIAALELLGYTKHVDSDGATCDGYEAELRGAPQTYGDIFGKHEDIVLL